MLQDLCNRLFYGIRSRLSLPLRWQDYQESGGEALWQTDFKPQVSSQLSEAVLRLNLFYGELLSAVPWGRTPQETGRWLDIGPKNFFYAPALATALSERYSRVHLEGLEMDPYRRYHNYYRRLDYALYYCRLAEEACPGVQLSYEGGNWLEASPRERYDGIFCFFPFVFEDLHLDWGLPKAGFAPLEFYNKAVGSCAEFVLVHQGEEELECSLQLIKRIGAKLVAIQRISHSAWVELKSPNYVLQVEGRLSAEGPRAHPAPRSIS